MAFPMKSECETYFTRSQIAIVKEAEHLILEDLSKRFTAKEMADRFGISESSYKRGSSETATSPISEKNEWKKPRNYWNPRI